MKWEARILCLVMGYWGFPPDGLRRLGRIVGLDDVEVVDQPEIDGHPRILALLRAAG